MTILYTLGSVALVSVVSFAGLALLVLLKEALLRRLILVLVSFAVGALFANVFLHILPEMAEESTDLSFSFRLVLLGLLLSFAAEKTIHWHHHSLDEEVHRHHHHRRPVGTLLLLGDGLHNFIDGMLIATAYLVDTPLGVATTIAVILHEIPQEIGDFAVLLHSGYTRGRALVLNFCSALTAVAGAAAVLLLHEYLEGIEAVLLPLVAGNFLYIAGSDLIPELHREPRLPQALTQFAAIAAGVALLWGLAQAAPDHGYEHEEDVISSAALRRV
jgi:zinc and cadmium transporter